MLSLLLYAGELSHSEMSGRSNTPISSHDTSQHPIIRPPAVGIFADLEHALRRGTESCFISFLQGDHLDALGFSVQLEMKKEKWRDYFAHSFPEHVLCFCKLDAILSRLKEAGHNVVACQMVSMKRIFLSTEQFYGWIETWSPYKVELAELHKEFWKDVIDTYMLFMPMSEDYYVLTFSGILQHVVVQK